MMDSAKVKRVVALNRQIASYKAMLKNTVLTADEADIAISDCNREIAKLRGQEELPLEGGTNPSEKPKKA